jgi:hypothetical protein
MRILEGITIFSIVAAAIYNVLVISLCVMFYRRFNTGANADGNSEMSKRGGRLIIISSIASAIIILQENIRYYFYLTVYRYNCHLLYLSIAILYGIFMTSMGLRAFLLLVQYRSSELKLVLYSYHPQVEQTEINIAFPTLLYYLFWPPGADKFETNRSLIESLLRALKKWQDEKRLMVWYLVFSLSAPTGVALINYLLGYYTSNDLDVICQMSPLPGMLRITSDKGPLT